MPKAAPTVIGSSAAINAGTASCTPGSPGTVVVGDIILILTESSDSTTAAGTPNIPAGYTRLFEETQGGGATGVTTLSVFATVAQGGDAMPTVDGVANHIGGRASIIRGAEPDVSQILVSTGNGANSGNVTLNAITITDDNCLLLGCMCTTNDANANNFTSPLTGWVNSELYDSSVNTGAGGGPALYIGNTDRKSVV